MIKILLFLLLLPNCFSESKIHAYNMLSKVSNGEYFLSKELELTNSDKEVSMVFIEGYEYLFVCKNTNNITPRIIIDDCEMKNDFMIIRPNIDGFKTINIDNPACSVMLVGLKKI